MTPAQQTQEYARCTEYFKRRQAVALAQKPPFDLGPSFPHIWDAWLERATLELGPLAEMPAQFTMDKHGVVIPT